jgi:hypothetical protein
MTQTGSQQEGKRDDQSQSRKHFHKCLQPSSVQLQCHGPANR